MVKISILSENNVRKPGLLGEHGLSLWIEKGERTILFDTGQSSVFYHNARAMGINLEAADYIILSHGHYDHCGGLQYFPYNNSNVLVYAHAHVFLKKFTCSPGFKPHNSKECRNIGVPFEISDVNWLADKVILTDKPSEIEPGVFLSGEIPCTNTFEELPQDFFVEKDGKIIHDMMLDEQMLIIEDNNELIIVLGCSHPGVINSVVYAQKLMPGKDIKLLIGGMHLENVNPARLSVTIEFLRKMNIQNIVPLHCTGFQASYEMKKLLGKNCSILNAGDVLEV